MGSDSDDANCLIVPSVENRIREYFYAESAHSQIIWRANIWELSDYRDGGIYRFDERHPKTFASPFVKQRRVLEFIPREPVE